jgi:hypothetical protein
MKFRSQCSSLIATPPRFRDLRGDFYVANVAVREVV